VLNYFFTTLYSDIKNVYYEREYKDNYIKYNLIVTKFIYGSLIDIDFKLESSGTQNILDLFPYLVSACEGQTVIIDELDVGIHDLMVNNILENISPFIKGQMIITTHNTMLIESDIPKENIYVFNVNGNAEKELLAITDFNGRIHKNINPRKKYLNGFFGGVPSMNDIDFEDIIDNLR
ncbi:MAG: AAA family ATPase, partial [Bacilli bacterium]|nr:AAA family ATPase [Bacilli bacterium]